MNKISAIFLLLIFVIAQNFFAQVDPMLYQRWNIMDINRVRTQFNNTGLLCDGNQQNIPLAHPPAFEYPNGSGLNYGTAIAIVIGAPAAQDPGAVSGSNSEGLEYLDATLDEGPAAFWDEEHFAPYPEVVGNEKAAISTDPATWPVSGPNQGWPANIPGTNQPLLVGAQGWPGLGPNGDILADQETYSVMHGWQGTDISDSERRWLNTSMEMRGMAWSGELYQDFIVWIFVIRNIGTSAIKDLRIGVHNDYGFIPQFLSPVGYGDIDRHYYDPKLQFAYGTDDNSYEESPKGGTLGAADIAWGGTLVLRMPGASKSVKTYDAFHFWQEATTPRGNGASKELYYRYNLSNSNDPQDSDKDGIDDDFDLNGVPDASEGGLGYYAASGADGIQTLGSEAFTLEPGQTDTLIFATVFGMSKGQLFKNANNASILYKSNWQVVKAPSAPRVEIVPQDGKNIIYWSTESESEKKFEGYKIYRSVDNGVTWGSGTFTDFTGTLRYLPLQQYDKVDSINGNYRTLPEFAWFNLGTETGLPPQKILNGTEGTKYFEFGDTVRFFTDDDVVNGQKYRYYIAAYDTGNGITGPLENTAASNPKMGTNTIEVVPHAEISNGSMSKVRAVPNPYIIASGWEIGKERILQFTHLPGSATIKIYNTAGELIRTLDHDAGAGIAESIAVWDLLNEDKQLVAAGLYLYHIDSPEGSAQGKIIIIQ